MRMHLLDLLKTRLRLADAWKRQPQAGVEFSPIARPIFITGTPRSGSTFLHELLAADSALRAPRVWEVMFPVTANEPDRGWRDRRVWNAATSLWWFRRLSRGADAVYPMRARTPHECVAIYSYCLMSEEFVSSCRVPAYEAFLRSSDWVPVYRWERRFLQHLQQNQRVTRWVLKAPDHVYALDALFSVFPDAMVIQTHRDPLQVLKSSIHMNWVLRGLYAPIDDLIQLAEREARVLAGMTDRVMRFRCARPELAEQIYRCELYRIDRRSACGHQSNLWTQRFDPDPRGRRAHTTPSLEPVALSRPSFHSQSRRSWIGRPRPGGPYWHARPPLALAKIRAANGANSSHPTRPSGPLDRLGRDMPALGLRGSRPRRRPDEKTD